MNPTIRFSKNKAQKDIYNVIPFILNSKIEKITSLLRDEHIAGKTIKISKVSFTIKDSTA